MLVFMNVAFCAIFDVIYVKCIVKFWGLLDCDLGSNWLTDRCDILPYP